MRVAGQVGQMVCYHCQQSRPRFLDPDRGIDSERGEGQRVRGSTGSNRGSTGGIDPVYI